MPVHAHLRQRIPRRDGPRAVETDAGIVGIVRHQKAHAVDDRIGEPGHVFTVLVVVVVTQHRRGRRHDLQFAQNTGVADIARMDDMVAIRQGAQRRIGQAPMRVRDQSNQLHASITFSFRRTAPYPFSTRSIRSWCEWMSSFAYICLTWAFTVLRDTTSCSWM